MAATVYTQETQDWKNGYLTEVSSNFTMTTGPCFPDNTALPPSSGTAASDSGNIIATSSISSAEYSRPTLWSTPYTGTSGNVVTLAQNTGERLHTPCKKITDRLHCTSPSIYSTMCVVLFRPVASLTKLANHNKTPYLCSKTDSWLHLTPFDFSWWGLGLRASISASDFPFIKVIFVNLLMSYVIHFLCSRRYSRISLIWICYNYIYNVWFKW